ncbi:PREDICTED: BAG family molecular chaperone regulator 4, partial [Acanthisitta chloris]|uniref:BAG family molecular chaperone regulator 4 n=1 Tax=Acanthisitta chloris TaxID=57068 RepID=UPI0004F0D82E
ARAAYCSGPARVPYPAEPSGLYRPPSPAPTWSYSSPECPAEGSALRRQQVPGYSPPQGPVPQPRVPEDTWGPSSAYGVQPRYAWPAASAHGNLYVSDSHPSWSSTGAPSHPSAWDSQVQDSAYDRPEQSPSQHSYYSNVNHQHSGAANEHRLAKAPPSHPRVQYSAQPQLYDVAPRKPGAGSREPGLRPGDQPSTNSAAIQPEIQRILHVMGEAELLEQEVINPLLEEMLTKLLLELDSIETGGQDSVRQARKESVHRIQAILEKLERKGL